MGFKPLAKKGIIDSSASSEPGVNGKSAYEVAVDNGYTGTAIQWLASLVGPSGANGTGTPGEDGREIELQKSSTHIQWRYVGETAWGNLVALTEIKGDPGLSGGDGTDGQEVELQKTATHIQWRYVGGSWVNLIALTDITGPQGNPGADGLSQAQILTRTLGA